MVFEMNHITKVYPDGKLANDDVSICLKEGEILAIVGENGAGKSTIMKILYGLVKPTEGEIVVRGKKVRFRSPSDAMAAGFGMVQQHFMLFDDMTVAENIVFRNEPHRGPFMDMASIRATVNALSEKYALKIDPDARIADCPVGLRQRVEILKVLYQNAEIILFDEPSAVLTPLEVDALIETMRALAKAGKSIVIITHKLREVMAVSDRVYVMRAGRLVAERMTAQTSAEELAELMVGHRIETRVVPEKQPGETLLQTKDLHYVEDGREVLHGIDISVHAGEIVGIAGVSGNGQTELVNCITGLEKPASGSVRVCGKEVAGAPVKAIRDAGLSHIPEDRFLTGSAREATLCENMLMGKQDRAPFTTGGVTHRGRITEYAERLIRDFSIMCSGADSHLRELSGGNAQKVIVAREMSLDTPVIVCSEPTRGVDVGAMDAIHDRLVERRNAGGAVLLVSSELSEIMSLSDRVYVLFEGRVNGEFRRGQVDDKTLGLLMTGGMRA